MTMDDHVRRGHPIMMGLLITFAIVELSLAAWLTAQFNRHHNQSSNTERDRVRFTLFASVWTVIFASLFVVLFTLSPTGSVLSSVIAHLVFLSLTWLIWTAAAAAITENLSGGLNCSTQIRFVYCGQLNALEAFAWIIWILVTLSIIFVTVRGVMGSRRGNGVRSGLVA
ncbi:hypothetical protein GGX14DRAFT_478897 [Mycena pura]|uniref:MARVEL domain-containing protein n=1 Tax=Mycena pura TaxID=153505 RepID=A0AAD6XYZ1_9AGAR|nr:hypothetical protein GGX14DRAFT_478897 [Mycena pura]